MDNTKLNIPAGGLYGRGVIVSSQAKAFKRKDGSGIIVLISHEIALQPGLVPYEQWLDPKEHPEIKLDGLTVLAFPKMANLLELTFKVLEHRIVKDKLILTKIEILAPAAKN